MSELNTKGTVFRPVECTETAMKTSVPIDGFVYFATDTGRIYLGSNGSYLPMGGGNSGVFYATKTIDEITIEKPIFSIDDIESDEMPSVDDLIINLGLNVDYNGFYRVVDIISETEVLANYLPVGGSSSGGTTSGSAAISYVSPTQNQIKNGITILTGNDFSVTYQFDAQDASGEEIVLPGLGTWVVNGVEIASEQILVGRHTYTIPSKYLDPNIDYNSIKLNITIDTGGNIPSKASKTWQIKVINFKLEWPYAYNEKSYINDETFSLSFTPYGSVDCTAHIVFDNSYEPGVSYFTRFIKASETNKLVYSDLIPSFSYGAHTCEIYLTAEIDGTLHTSNSIKNEITFILDGTTSILTVPYYKDSANQYETLNIPFLVYDPDAEKVKVNFYADGVLIDTMECDRDLQSWPYSITNYGNITLTIATINNEARKDIELSVSKLNLDISEVPGYAFKLKATDFSGNEGLRNWNSNGVTLEFSDNFDWINGGLKFEEKENGIINKYICVRQGTRMTINYELFNKGNPSGAGKVFKFCFKATNCYDYEAPVLECYEEAANLGLKYDAQKAIFSTNVNKNFNTQYYENSYIELEAEIWPDVKDSADGTIQGDRFLMFWVDGIPVKVESYITGTNFENINNHPKIVIGSDLCDVYVYTAKVYERRLTEDEHITNFIMDAPNGTELLKRYNRNNILGPNGDISYERLIQQNPDCRAYLYEVPHVTQNKDDKVKGCTYTEYYQTTDKPIRTATDVVTRVQGTSSAAYGVAAFNLRSDFSDGVILDENGHQIDGWGVSDTAIPIDYFCTKVNVASSENANNVVNQEWYNKFQPYHDAHRRKARNDGKLYRDCMEFNSGVIFIKDLNKNDEYYKDGKPDTGAYLAANAFLDTDNYVNSPYYKQYAIGNMGNDKKNSEVFHDTTNPNACCVEVTDNQTAEQFMTARVDNATVWLDDDDMPFEFRYPDGNDKATSAMKEAFVKFVNWMADSNPKAYTNNDLGKTVHFDPYTFKGFSPPGYEGKSSPTGISLEGVTISRYAGDYDKDTYEYRMAKMLSECEDHLVMDSVVYHYLFIQRHTMVDNVAKNTFWSTEDLKHWDLTKNYDNDTSDGNNNSGFLTYTYGLECLDRTESGLSVFNAPDSVWINFIFGLPEAQQDLYQKLAVAGAWDPDAYLAEFKKHQEIIPERCWVYDYFRKYIRPGRLGLDTGTYLNRLEGGKKTHQREQYERYQDFYINSKYIAGNDNTQGAALDLRLNMTSEHWSVDNVIPIQYYIDCYSQSLIGGVNFSSPERIKRGTVFNIPVGQKLTNVNDSTCYIYGARMIQMLSGLPRLYPTYIGISKAVKLRSLTAGSNDEGYENKSLEEIDIKQNTMLQEAFIQNCTNSKLGALDLSKLYQLEDLQLNGSAFSGLIMADGAITETLYINPVNTLKMANLSKLTDLRLDEGIYDNLTELNVTNCPIMDPHSYALVLNGKIQRYNFDTFIWESISGNDFVYNIDNVNKIKKIQSITALENLINRAKPTTNSTAASLIGTLQINLPTSEDGYTYAADEFEIYKKYCKAYPNLIIQYGANFGNNLTKAITITFKASENSTASHYRVLSDGNTALDKLITAEGPLGQAMADPAMESTEQYDYTFTHYWKNGTQLYYDSTIEAENALDGSESLMALVPNSDIEFIPVFEEKLRTYSVRFFDGTNIIPQGELDSWPVPYGQTYNGPMIDYYYKEHAEDEYRYEFKGWSDSPIINSNPVLISSIQNYVVTGNTNIYAYCEEVNNTQTATDYKYFNITGNAISLKDEYKNVFKGKITLPSKTADGKYPLKEIADRAFYPKDGESLITHVFFLGDAEYTTVGKMAFATTANELRLGKQALKAVYLPSTITTIGNNAFQYQIDLTTIGNIGNVISIGDSAFTTDISFYQDTHKMKLIIDELPPNIKSIGASAFMGCGEGVKVTYLPESLATIGSNAFANSKGVKPYIFGSNSEDKNYLSILESGAFQNSGVGSINNGTIEIYSSIGPKMSTTLLPEGFIGYSVFMNTGVKKVIFYNEELYNAFSESIIFGGAEMTYGQYWGFSTDVAYEYKEAN